MTVARAAPRSARRTARKARLARRAARIQTEIDRIGVREHGLIEGRHFRKVRGANAQRLERRHPPVALDRPAARGVSGAGASDTRRARPVVSGEPRSARAAPRYQAPDGSRGPTTARWPRSPGCPTPTISNAARPTCANLCCVANTPTSQPCARPHRRRPRPGVTRRARSASRRRAAPPFPWSPCCG